MSDNTDPMTDDTDELSDDVDVDSSETDLSKDDMPDRFEETTLSDDAITGGVEAGSAPPTSDGHNPQTELDAPTGADAGIDLEDAVPDPDDDTSPISEPKGTGDDGQRTPGEADWEEETKRQYDPPETELELLKKVDAFLDAIDEDLEIARERQLAGEHYQTSDWAGNETTTQSKLGFDYVRDDGIIVDGDTYYGLQRVNPTRWRSRDQEGKKQIMGAYIAFLKSLRWSIAIPCYPKAFDFDKYLESVYEAGTKAVAEGANPILDYGRRHHILWADQEIDPSKVKRKEFFIVIPVSKSWMRNSMGVGDSLAKQLMAKLMPSDSDTEEEVEQQCIDEIKQRRQTIKNELPRTGVEVIDITERQLALEHLYHYFNHVEPVLDSAEMSTFTQADFSGDF